MSPTDRRPISPRLLNQLAATLRSVEGARRKPADREEAVGSALRDLESLAGMVEGAAGDGAVPDTVPGRLEEAREALEADSVDEAREILVGVGRSIDEYLKG